jgi:FAD-dependent urate hydroxylase
MRSTDCDVAIIGAGPYGLAAAAHLSAASGLDVRVFGDVMSFWEHQMPEGMFLRSPYVASNIADPERGLSLDSFASESHTTLPRPLPVERFVDYGRWFRRQVSPALDGRSVTQINSNGSFQLELSDGTRLTSSRVVVAAGIMPFARKPPQFEGLPRELASHSSEHREFSRFAGRRVFVVGGGQSALESAALLHEAGAEVEVLVRAPRIYFLRRIARLHHLGPLTRLLFAPAEVGPAGLSRLVSAPNWYRRLPRSLQDRFAVRSLRPAGAAWLVSRLEQVPITLGTSVVSAEAVGDEVALTLSDGSHRRCDHVLLATGYRVDIGDYPFMSGWLMDRIASVDGCPRLNAGFESSLPNLFFLGAPSAWSFGPLMRFVAGTEFAAPALARAILRKKRR